MFRVSLAPEGFEAAEWQRFDTLCDGLEGVLELPKADALQRIEDLQAETDRISEGIRADIEPRERERCDDTKVRNGQRLTSTHWKPRDSVVSRAAQPHLEDGAIYRPLRPHHF